MILDRDRFEAWLRSQPPDAIAGWPGDACDCPLARFGQSRTRGHLAVTPLFVTNDDLDFEAPERADYFIQATPEWAAAFIELVDRRRGFVTAAEALEQLAEVAP